MGQELGSFLLNLLCDPWGPIRKQCRTKSLACPSEMWKTELKQKISHADVMMQLQKMPKLVHGLLQGSILRGNVVIVAKRCTAKKASEKLTSYKTSSSAP